MNTGEFIELTVITIIFILDAMTLHWYSGEQPASHPPRVVRGYLFHRQNTVTRYISLLA